MKSTIFNYFSAVKKTKNKSTGLIEFNSWTTKQCSRTSLQPTRKKINHRIVSCLDKYYSSLLLLFFRYHENMQTIFQRSISYQYSEIAITESHASHHFKNILITSSVSKILTTIIPKFQTERINTFSINRVLKT